MNRLSAQLTESAAWNSPEPVQNIYTGHKPEQNSKKKICKMCIRDRFNSALRTIFNVPRETFLLSSQ